MTVDVKKEKFSIEDLLQIMALMRDPNDGCKWTQAQDWSSLVHHTIEEAYEIVDAVEQRNADEVKGELADMLNQIIFYSHIAQEEGKFSFEDVVSHLARKLIDRHPNVFLKDGSEDLTFGELELQWEEIKKQENINKAVSKNSLLDNITHALPALSVAQKLQKKASSVGFDWNAPADILPKLDEELKELENAYGEQDIEHSLEEVGDIMFTCVNLIRHLGSDAETVMRNANRKFETRFRKLEMLVDLDTKALPSKQILEEAWKIAKISKH